MNKLQSQVLGYPRMGEKRQLKKALELYWKDSCGSSKDALVACAAEIKKTNWQAQKCAGLSYVTVNDFSYYDQVLDTSLLLNIIPDRFAGHKETGVFNSESYFSLLFAIARGSREDTCGCGSQKGTASEMTKWFDTNYHYIVPEFSAQSLAGAKLKPSKLLAELNEAQNSGVKAKPVVIGPVTYVRLGKSSLEKKLVFDKILPLYLELLQTLSSKVELVQFDEPIFALDLTDEEKEQLKQAYGAIAAEAKRVGIKIQVCNYFGSLGANFDLYSSLPVDVLHFDLVRGNEDVSRICKVKVPQVSLGLVNGRNIWINDLESSVKIAKKVVAELGADRVIIASSCSLLHSPVTLRHENKLEPWLKEWLAFAEEKLLEIEVIANAAGGSTEKDAQIKHNKEVLSKRASSERVHNRETKERLAGITPEMFDRKSPFVERIEIQREKLGYPLFPTTTIGSFPQTSEIRSLRVKLKAGELTAEQYDAALMEETKKCIAWQEDVGLDVLVHGEYERNDMVEYFGELLNGFAFTKNGWVQSYGSRCVKPPIIFGDVSRTSPMTVGWSSYAQGLTAKPMKGMLTGPITILQWSFVREDISRKDVSYQIALALRDEVVDLADAGLKAIQIDEPALREGLPLRSSEWNEYLDWSVKAFRLSASGISDDVQIHTHMCYCEFNDIIDSIAALDADVISIEASRSNMELLQAFVDFKYPNDVGPGIYDIHSPRVPEKDEMVALAEKACEVLNPAQIWINPDCGLKTRGWPEVKESLLNLVAVAKELRGKYQK